MWRVLTLALLVQAWAPAAWSMPCESDDHDECDHVGLNRVKRGDDFPAMESELHVVAGKVTKQEAEIAALRHTLTQLQASLKTARTAIGFTAYKASSHFAVAGGGTVVLDHMEGTQPSSSGSGYDRQTGFFTAPLSGSYVFILTIRAYKDTTYLADIVREGTTYARCIVPHSNMQATCHAHVHLSKGQRVWVKNAGSSSSHTTEDFYGLYYTHLTGFLVQAD